MLRILLISSVFTATIACSHLKSGIELGEKLLKLREDLRVLTIKYEEKKKLLRQQRNYEKKLRNCELRAAARPNNPIRYTKEIDPNPKKESFLGLF